VKSEYVLPSAIRAFVERAAGSDLPVLLLGERGTGKTVLARLIHEGSHRSRAPFRRLDLTSVSPTLTESELFGHEKGAFTGADGRKVGLVEQAHGGTLLFDEIDALPVPLQRKLLTFLEEGTIRRVGSPDDRTVDVRAICATNADLGRLLARGELRPDLLDRIHGMAVRLPPLRERVEEIPDLCRLLAPPAWIAARPGDEDEDRAFELEPGAIDLLKAQRWPGNIRELRHVLARAFLASGSPRVTSRHVEEALASAHIVLGSPRPEAKKPDPGAGPVPPTEGRDRYERLDDRSEERRRVVKALRASEGRRREAAASLGMSRTMLWKLIREFGSPPTSGAREGQVPAGRDGGSPSDRPPGGRPGQRSVQARRGLFTPCVCERS